MKKANNTVNAAVFSAVINAVYAAFNMFVGLSESSWWFINISFYFLILSFIRSVVIIARSKDSKSFVGIMLMITSLPLLGIAIISAVKDVGNKYHEIVMITMALYAFTKVTLAIINLTKSRRQRSSAESALRSISLADALVSIASLQRSMLVSFGEMTASEIRLFNILTGSGVCILVFILGLNLLMKKREDI